MWLPEMLSYNKVIVKNGANFKLVCITHLSTKSSLGKKQRNKYRKKDTSSK